MTQLEEKIKEIILGMDLGYKYLISDYATSDKREKEYEEEGIKEVNEVTKEILSLIATEVRGMKLDNEDEEMRVYRLGYQTAITQVLKLLGWEEKK